MNSNRPGMKGQRGRHKSNKGALKQKQENSPSSSKDCEEMDEEPYEDQDVEKAVRRSKRQPK